MKGITVASRKQKGRKFQQEVRDKILEAFPPLEPDDVVSTSMGAGGEDIKLSPAARKLFPYSVECKSVAKAALYSWYEQAKANCPKGTEPIVCAKANRKTPVVIVSLDHYMELTKRKKK